MNRIAFVFYSAPHGTASGREGLDAIIATSMLTENIGVFFISDGVFQLLAGQQPQIVLARDYISTFKVLLFYNIKVFWVCSTSLWIRGLNKNMSMVLEVLIIDSNILRKELANYNIILTF